MPDITVHNDNQVDVVSTLMAGRLQLSVEGVIIGTVTDEFNPPVPSTMRLFIYNLPDGSPVSAQWQPISGGAWWSFTPTTGGVYADFPVPPVGSAPTEYRFVALATEHGIHIDDPRLVLKTKQGARTKASKKAPAAKARAAKAPAAKKAPAATKAKRSKK